MKIIAVSKTFAPAVCALCVVASFLPVAALAQPYPNKPIRLIVPFPAGGGVDFIGRIIGQKLSERLGQQVAIDNRAGANGIVGLELLKQSPPDGYTIAAASAGPLAVNPFIYAKLPYDTPEGLHSHREHGEFPAAAGRASVAAGEKRARTDRAREKKSRPAFLFAPGRRQFGAPRRRTVQYDGESEDTERPLQGHRARRNRAARRRSPADLQQHPDRIAARKCRQAARARHRQ